jgi:arylsulfatase A-like enzyme
VTESNILLVVLDAVRKDHLPPYGYEEGSTPTLDRLADVSTRYEEAIAPAPWTPPSHASMFTGRYPSHHGVFGRQPQYGTSQPHIAEELSAAGYSTLGFSNSYHTSKARGFDRGFDFYHDIRDLPHVRGKWFEPSIPFAKLVVNHYRDGHDIASFQLDKFERTLGADHEPFFGFINLNSAHSPYNPPEKFKREFEDRFDSWDTVDESAARNVGNRDGYKYMMGEIEMGDAEWELVKRWYDGEIAYMDRLLGRFFEALREMGLFENTMIVVTADHGESFGEDGLAYHKFSLGEQLINVPLFVKWPDQDTGEVSDELVSLTDFAPTFLDVAGAPQSIDVDGRSLASDPEPETVFAEFGRPYEGTLNNLVESMFENCDLENESLTDRLIEYTERIDRYNRGLQAARTHEYKLVKPTRGDRELYRLGDDGETLVENAEIEERLLGELTANLGDLPTESHSEDLPGHIEDHLTEMGYL